MVGSSLLHRSDHIPILRCLEAPLFRATPLTLNWVLTDWPQLDIPFKNFEIPLPLPIPWFCSLGSWFETNHNRVTALLALNTPLKQVTHRSKPWWSTTLSLLRTAYNVALWLSQKEHATHLPPFNHKSHHLLLLQCHQKYEKEA